MAAPDFTIFYERFQNMEQWKALRRAYQENPLQFLSKGAFWVALACSVMVFGQEVLTAYHRLTTVPYLAGIEITGKPPIRIAGLPLSGIIQAHLFGAEKVKPKAGAAGLAEGDISAPITSLSLVLKGVFTAKEKNAGSAIIAGGEGDKKEDKFYKVGAVLPGPAILRQVYEDRVVIEYQGRLESLWLYEPDDKKTRPVTPTHKEKRSVTKPQPSRTMDKRGDKALSRMLSNYHHLLQTEPMQLLTVLRFTPAEIKGKMTGFRIEPGVRKGDFASLGLQENDIVTAINGMSLDSPGKGAEVFEQLKGAPELTIDLQRRGQGLRIMYGIQ